eukprot:TRINITY_DN493_c2_g1_i2.p1 TRINITY_DN493_c2_g1~~TRINITY_DN493_c2_g1_i2.p1  ORF type:complete len:149 (-),score=22.27 TRINITY_DN493_c2_g1_i2:21-467(-)
MPKPKIDYDAVPATYTPMMSFNRGYWEEALHKVGCDTPAPPGATVSTRALRESFMECACFWPTNPEPPGCDGRLDVEAHRKFCYFAQRAENQAAEPPKGYIPIAYEDKPEEWFVGRLTRLPPQPQPQPHRPQPRPPPQPQPQPQSQQP